MESLEQIRQRGAKAQAIFDLVWDVWVSTGKWPKSRVIHSKINKATVGHYVAELNDAYLMECDPSHDPTYELRLFGVLSMSRGDEWLILLTRFLEFLRDAYQADPGREVSFRSEEVGRQARLSSTETITLGRLLSFHPFEMMNLGFGSPPFEGWECGIPKGFDEIGQAGPAREKLEDILARRYQPRAPVMLEERQRALVKMNQLAVNYEPWHESDASVPEVEVQSTAQGVVPFGAPSPSENRVEVFISHANKDKDLAEAVIDLLNSGLGLTRDKIRCTTADGSKLPLGADIDRQIRSEICTSKLLIGLLTPLSLNSAYVLFEMGARWGEDGSLVGLFAKGATGNSLTGPMSRLNVLNAHNEADLHLSMLGIAEKLGVALPNPSVYLTMLKRVSEVSRAGDPFVKYDRMRVKVRGQHKKEHYFVHQSRTHYLEPSAAEVCEQANLAYISIEPEEADVLFTALDEPLNAVQIRNALSEAKQPSRDANITPNLRTCPQDSLP